MPIQHTKKKPGTFLWFILSLIPILNLYWYWKVTRVLVEHEEVY